ncbi:glycosyltransferase [Polymorphospora rubra]|uniref:glycosyltransferase n=1 Tax=Polymorphospora rubra TaxID=338584 RepID=UPI0033D32624
MRVVHFTDTYLPRRDGVVTSVRTLADALADRGHPGLTVVPRHPDQPDEPALLRLPAIPCGIANLRLSPWLLRPAPAAGTLAAIAATEPDIVHVHTPGPLGLLGVLAARQLGLPLVQTYHTDLEAYADAYRVPVPALRGAVRLYARRLGVPRPPARPGAPTRPADRRRDALDRTNTLLLGDADAVVVPTRAVLDRISLPVPDDRIFLVPTGVAPRPTTTTAATAFRARHGLGPNHRVVLFVGRVNREKGVDLLVSAFTRIAAGNPDARLVLVGAVVEPRWLTARLRAAGPYVTDRIILTGQQPPEEVAAAYRAADVFAFPSLTDTQALVLQEAALAALPAVLVDPGLHRHGPLAGAAVRTDPDPDSFAAGIRGLLDHPDTARRTGRQAAVNAGRHTPARYAEAMCDVYAHASTRAGAVRAGRLSDRGRTRS